MSWLVNENNLIAHYEITNEEDLLSGIDTILKEIRTL